ncbi:hypothetical protein JX266_009521 [Neoarthrinium moseri]|nr:hypothetical protein JX266_009521 [Neoarthrinium moseri]
MDALIWDNNPDAHRFAEAAVKALLASFPGVGNQNVRKDRKRQGKGPSVLEIGCGTGVFSLRLLPYVGSILAVDVSHPMIQVLRLKIAEMCNPTERKHIAPLCLSVEDPEDPALPPGQGGKRKKFDLVTGHLLLHHVADHKALLETMFGCLKPGGRLALTDFADFGPEARLFHPEGRMGDVEHDQGVNPKAIEKLMRQVGFEETNVSVAWTSEKEVERFPGEWGPKGLQKPESVRTMEFSFVLCSGRKPKDSSKYSDYSSGSEPVLYHDRTRTQ